MIDRNKKISKLRQQEVEHGFETMVGCRKNRYCNTPEQKQRTEFFEDYYLLYTRKDEEIKILKKALYLATEQISEFQFGCEEFNMCQMCSNFGAENCADIECEDGFVKYFLNKAREMLKNE